MWGVIVSMVGVVWLSAGSTAAAMQGTGPAVVQATGRVEGRVSDPTGAGLPGAHVELVAPDHPPQSTSTGVDGHYRIDGLPVGIWDLRVSLPGFTTVRRPRVMVAAGATRTASFTLYVSASTAVLVTARDTFRQLADADAQDALVGLADAASTGIVTPFELNERARRRPAEVLEAVPGLVVSQHSGEGKANQYYVRGFNVDHGTDLSMSVAGMPVNLPTHAHGQGYADLNFLIPELVGGMQYRKGVQASEAGDFSAAGTIRISYLNVLDRPMARLETGAFGYGRALAAVSPRAGRGTLLVAAEGLVHDGPWERPDAMRRANGVVRYSQGTTTSGWSVTALAYRAQWFGTDQIPRRAVDAGRLGRFGTLDRTSGGVTHRAGGVAEWQSASARGVRRVEAFGFHYGLDLYSNFTYGLDDPDRGDQFEQRDARMVGGLRVSQLRRVTLVGRESTVAVGTELRHDHIGTVGLYRTVARRRVSTVREDAVRQTSGAAYLQLDTQWSPFVRTSAGVRADLYRWHVRAGDPVNGGTVTDGLVNPKLSVALGPWRRTEVYAGLGGGFHSNDGRGATLRRDPVTGEDADPVDPLVRARGAEIGVRTLALPGLHTTLTLWGLGLGSELVFVGDAGTTTASRPSRRVGLEWDADYRVSTAVSLEASAAWSRARFTDAAPEGSRVPGAIEGVAMAGVRVSPSGPWSGSLRWRFFGPRPLIEDNAVRSRPSNLVNGEVGYRFSPRLRLKADVLNVFNSRSSDIDYFYRSRLPGEPAEGVDGVHFHPVEPTTLRVSLLFGF